MAVSDKSNSGVRRGVRVASVPAGLLKPRRPTLIQMSPYALKLFARRWYMLGFGDTGKGFHGESMDPTSRVVRSLLTTRFDHLYKVPPGI